MTAQRRAAILLAIAALAAGPFSAGTGAAPAHAAATGTHLSGGVTINTINDRSPYVAATPDPPTRWFGSITVAATMNNNLKVPTGATVEAGTCSATFRVNDTSVSGTVTALNFTTNWPDHPQPGETETSKMQLKGPAGTSAPVLLKNTAAPVVQVTPHPLFNTVDYEIGGAFGWPTVPATFDQEITGTPTDGGTPDYSPGARDGAAGCGDTGDMLDWLVTLSNAAGNGDEFRFSTGIANTQLDPACREAANQPRLSLDPIIAIRGTASGDGSALSGEAKACVIDTVNKNKSHEYPKVGTVTVTWHLTSRPSCSSQGAQGTGAMGGAALPALTVPGVSVRPDTRAMHLGDTRVAQGYPVGCQWYGTIHTTISWPPNQKPNTIYLDSGLCESTLIFSPPGKVSGWQSFDSKHYTKLPNGTYELVEYSSMGRQAVAGQKGNPVRGVLTDDGGRLDWESQPIPIWKATSHYALVNRTLVALDDQEWHDAGVRFCTPQLASKHYFDSRHPHGTIGPFLDSGSGHPPAATTFEYDLYRR